MQKIEFNTSTIKCDNFTSFNQERTAVLSIFNHTPIEFDENETLLIKFDTPEGTFLSDWIIYVTDIRSDGLMNMTGGTRQVTVIEGTILSPSEYKNPADEQYLGLIRDVLENGTMDGNRTDTRAQHCFGNQLKFDLRQGFPLITTKKVNIEAIIDELCWFMRGETNTTTLGSRIWDEWAAPDGELGPVYGAQWRRWPAFNLAQDDKQLNFLLEQGYTNIGTTPDKQAIMYKKVDQLQDLVDSLKSNPANRRNLVTAWNPANNPDTKYSPSQNAEFGMQALPPCHTFWQVNGCRMTAEQRLEEYVKVCALEIFHSEKSFELDELEKQLGYSATLDDVVEDVEKAFWKQVDVEMSENKDVTDIEQALVSVLDQIKAPEFYLDVQLYQRSADLFLGVPFNIASYAALTLVLAQHTNMIPRNFIHTFGNYHIYENHFDQVRQQLEQKQQPLPTMLIENKFSSISEYTKGDFRLINYRHGPVLRGKVAV